MNCSQHGLNGIIISKGMHLTCWCNCLWAAQMACTLAHIFAIACCRGYTMHWYMAHCNLGITTQHEVSGCFKPWVSLKVCQYWVDFLACIHQNIGYGHASSSLSIGCVLSVEGQMHLQSQTSGYCFCSSQNCLTPLAGVDSIYCIYCPGIIPICVAGTYRSWLGSQLLSSGP